MLLEQFGGSGITQPVHDVQRIAQVGEQQCDLPDRRVVAGSDQDVVGQREPDHDRVDDGELALGVDRRDELEDRPRSRLKVRRALRLADGLLIGAAVSYASTAFSTSVVNSAGSNEAVWPSSPIR